MNLEEEVITLKLQVAELQQELNVVKRLLIFAGSSHNFQNWQQLVKNDYRSLSKS